MSQRKSPCPAVFPIPRATSEPGCLLSSQIPPCSPPTQSLQGGENHDTTIFPHPGVVPSQEHQVEEVLLPGWKILSLLASAQATLPGPSRPPAARLCEGESPSARGQLLPAKTPPRCYRDCPRVRRLGLSLGGGSSSLVGAGERWPQPSWALLPK